MYFVEVGFNFIIKNSVEYSNIKIIKFLTDLDSECFFCFDILLNMNHKSHANMSLFGREVTLHSKYKTRLGRTVMTI